MTLNISKHFIVLFCISQVFACAKMHLRETSQSDRAQRAIVQLQEALVELPSSSLCHCEAEGRSNPLGSKADCGACCEVSTKGGHRGSLGFAASAQKGPLATACAPRNDKSDVELEAALVAKALVNQTLETNKEFKMTGGPKWHNFLIKLGIRKKGYCYQWVPELLNALPPYPLKYFERHWGGSFQSMGRENNAVIITKRGAPLETGIVYDAWRGVGRPFWILVAQDKKYRWRRRFDEQEILAGEAKVEPK